MTSHKQTPYIKLNGVEIAETILLPGDPLRAKFIAETFLEDAVCFNEVRGMLGYTGTYKGKKISFLEVMALSPVWSNIKQPVP